MPPSHAPNAATPPAVVARRRTPPTPAVTGAAAASKGTTSTSSFRSALGLHVACHRSLSCAPAAAGPSRPDKSLQRLAPLVHGSCAARWLGSRRPGCEPIFTATWIDLTNVACWGVFSILFFFWIYVLKYIVQRVIEKSHAKQFKR